MAVIPGMDTLTFFRKHKDLPVIQFLTWYILLVQEWSFEDIIEVLGRADIEPREVFGVREEQQEWSFTFRNKRTITLTLIRNSRGEWYCAHSWEVVAPVPDDSIERLMECIIFSEEKEWKDCNVSTIIGDILAYFNERTNRHVQLVFLWHDMTFSCIRFDFATIKVMLDTLASFTGSTFVFQEAGVLFLEKKEVNEYAI